MNTDALPLQLPDVLRDFVADRVSSGAYANASAYLSDLVRRDREAQAAQRLRELIEEGLASGPATPLTDEEIAAIRARILAVGR